MCNYYIFQNSLYYSPKPNCATYHSYFHIPLQYTIWCYISLYFVRFLYIFIVFMTQVIQPGLNYVRNYFKSKGMVSWYIIFEFLASFLFEKKCHFFHVIDSFSNFDRTYIIIYEFFFNIGYIILKLFSRSFRKYWSRL